MRAFDPATIDRQRRHIDFLDRQHLQSNTRAHNIDDRIDRADLVEMNRVGRHRMDFSLGMRQPRERSQRAAADVFGKPAAVQYLLDVRQMPPVSLICLYQNHVDVGAGNSLFDHRRDRQFVAGNVQFREFRSPLALVDARM